MAPCLTLGFENGAGYELVIAPAPSEKLPAALRLAHDGELRTISRSILTVL